MKEPKLNFGNNQSEKIITKELKISQNVFIYNETIIPIPNISRISIADAVKEPYQIGHFIMVLIGVLCLFSGNIIFTLAGIVIGIFGGWLIYNIYEKNKDLGEYLVLCLNSGEKIFLYSKDHDFTIKIMDVMINCINSDKQYRINMENCNIEACQFGKNSVMKYEGGMRGNED